MNVPGERPKARFRVTIAKLEKAPYVGPDGHFGKTVTFGIQGIGNAFSTMYEGGLVGGETLRRCNLLKDLTHVIVEIEPQNGFSSNWQEKVANAALQGAANLAEKSGLR